MFERLHLSDMMQYLLRDMLCKMMGVNGMKNYMTAMMLPTWIKEDLMLLMVPLLLSSMLMTKVLLLFLLRGEQTWLMMMHK